MNFFCQDLDTNAVDQAITRCDAAGANAIQVVVPIDHAAGNDVACRDAAAALAALDASVRCDEASSAALEVAARFDAAAEAAAKRYHASSASAAEQDRAAVAHSDAKGAAARSRAAVARCAVAGANAASRAAIAFAASCDAACGAAVARSSEARAAAARCVLARDDAATALAVARKTPVWFGVSRATHRAHWKASRESAVFHKKARKDARAAALAAQKAAVSCAASSHRAVSAASVARKAAIHCDTAGGDGAEAAVAARRAADCCVAATADAVVAEATTGERAVPRADRAASEARKAAASCDEALSDLVAGADSEFLDKMRGWLMTVVALFVGMAFQAIVHPPDGMYFDRCRMLLTKAGKGAYRAPQPQSPAPAPAPSSEATVYNGWSGECLYLFSNTITMAIALSLLVALLTMGKTTSRISLYGIKGMLTLLAITVACSFITGTSGNEDLQLTTLIIFGLYALAASATRFALIRLLRPT